MGSPELNFHTNHSGLHLSHLASRRVVPNTSHPLFPQTAHILLSLIVSASPNCKDRERRGASHGQCDRHQPALHGCDNGVLVHPHARCRRLRRRRRGCFAFFEHDLGTRSIRDNYARRRLRRGVQMLRNVPEVLHQRLAVGLGGLGQRIGNVVVVRRRRYGDNLGLRLWLGLGRRVDLRSARRAKRRLRGRRLRARCGMGRRRGSERLVAPRGGAARRGARTRLERTRRLYRIVAARRWLRR